MSKWMEKKGMDIISIRAFRDELEKIAHEKDSGFLDSVKEVFTTPISGTPELFGGLKGGVNQATRFGGAGKGPSEGFKKFQQQRAQQMGKNAGTAVPVPLPVLPPPGLAVMFAPKPRSAPLPVMK